MESELRILQLGKFHPIRGGVEKVAYDLTDGLSRRGIRCDLMCAATHGGDRVIPLNGLANIIRCRTWMRLASTMIAPSMIFALRKARARYDIVHIHHPDPMACLALFLSGYRGKVVLHWHSDIQKQKLLLRFYRPLQDWLVRRADCIVGTTPVYLAESPFLKEVQAKTRCIPIGIDPMCPDAEAVETLRAAYPGRKIVFSLGRLVPYKGYRHLVEAARFLDDSYVVLIGGKGSLHDELQAQIDNLGLHGRVKLLGHVSDADLPACYGACRVFCLSSVQKTEAFGIVQIEAMSCGRPVVATRIPGSGVSWVNAEGVSGINVEPCRPKELAAAIRAVCDDEETYSRYAGGAKRRYEETFTKKQMIESCVKMYFDL